MAKRMRIDGHLVTEWPDIDEDGCWDDLSDEVAEQTLRDCEAVTDDSGDFWEG